MVQQVTSTPPPPPPIPGNGGGGSGYLYLHYWSLVDWEPAINVDNYLDWLNIFTLNGLDCMTSAGR